MFCIELKRKKKCFSSWEIPFCFCFCFGGCNRFWSCDLIIFFFFLHSWPFCQMFSAFSWQLTEYQRPFRINAALAAVIHLQAPSTLMLVSFSLSVFDVCGRGLWIIKLVWYYQCWAFSAATFIRTPGLVIYQHFINCTFCVLLHHVSLPRSDLRLFPRKFDKSGPVY